MRKLVNQDLNRLSNEEFKVSDKLPVYLVLDNVRSLNNIGSIFRTADAFRLSGIFLCGITGKPPHREIHKTALGATDTVDWEYFDNTLEAVSLLRAKGAKIYAIEQVDESLALQEFSPPLNDALALVFGNEINGVGEEVINLSDACIEIPQFGTKHSFNVAVSAGIVIYDISNKIKKTGKL